jgi:acyl carrier protein
MVDAIEAQVLAAIADAKKIPVDRIDPDRPLADLDIDSLDIVTLAFDLEDRLQITIPDESIRSIRTVRDIIEGVQTLAHAGRGQEGTVTPPQ